MSRLLTKQLLMSSSYWVLNKSVVAMFGIEAAFLLSNFTEAETMMADQDGWFYQTSDTVEEMTTLTRHKQDQCIKKLESAGVLEKKLMDMPAKRYFRINYECLTNMIVNNLQTRLSIIDKHDCKKSATIKKVYKELNNKELIKESPTPPEFDTHTKEYQLAKLLYEKMLLNDSRTKEPNLYNWAKDIDKLIRIDKRNESEVRTMIDFVTKDEFWKTNILSASKLRMQFPKLYLELKRSEKNGKYVGDHSQGQYDGIGIRAEDL